MKASFFFYHIFRSATIITHEAPEKRLISSTHFVFGRPHYVIYSVFWILAINWIGDIKKDNTPPDVSFEKLNRKLFAVELQTKNF